MFRFLQNIRHEQFKRECDNVTEKLFPHFPLLNELCQKEYFRLEQSRIIDQLTTMIIDGRTLQSLTVSEDGIVAYYLDGTSKQVWFRELGVCNLTYRVFTDVALRGRWNLLGTETRTSCINPWTYLDFCEFAAHIHRNGDAYTYSPGFNEIRAVAHILARRSKCPFNGPFAEEPSYSSQNKLWNQKVVFDAPVLKPW